MFLSREILALALKLGKGAYYAETCIARLYHIVDIAVLGCLIGVREESVVLRLLLCNECLWILGLFRFIRLKDFGCTCCTHDGNLGARPCVVEVGTQLLACHHNV